MKTILYLSHFLNFISKKIGLAASYLYYNYCIEKCYACNGSGFELLFNNDIKDCPECNGYGYTETQEEVKW